MNKAARKVIDYCISNDIGSARCRLHNETFQCNSRIGRHNNQNFVNIPYGQLRSKLEYLCELNGMVFVKQEESYTSKLFFSGIETIYLFTMPTIQKNISLVVTECIAAFTKLQVVKLSMLM